MNRDIRRVFETWWRRLNDVLGDPPRPQRGDLARLRRIDLAETEAGPQPDLCRALAEAEFRRLDREIRRVIPPPLRDWEPDLVTAAVTLAHIRTASPARSTAALLGGRDDDVRVMREVRFRRLMRTDTAADLFDQARRLATLLPDAAAPVGELGESLLLWRHRWQVRRDWARAYYQLDDAGDDGQAAAPSQEPASEPEP